MSKLLDIIIPTYNRSILCVRQINFILNEIQSANCLNDVNLIVSDNNSDALHKIELKSFINKYQDDVIFYENDNNLGLAGNLTVNLYRSKSKYIWFIGDDDVLKIGILKKVLEEIKNCSNTFGVLFINHDAIQNNKVVLKSAFKESSSLKDIFDQSFTSLMFITACVYNKNVLVESMKDQSERLTLPFYWTLYASEFDGLRLINEVNITNQWDNISWEKSRLTVMIPGVINELLLMHKKCNYNTKYIIFLIKYLLNHKVLLLRYIKMKFYNGIKNFY